MSNSKTLHILWTNSDINTSLHMVMMYAKNSLLKGWWENVTVIIWGAPAKLISENEEVQREMRTAMDTGVKFSACVACARRLGVIENLEALGVEILPWGEPLTDILRADEKLITV